MVDFICIGLLDLWGERTENILPKVGYEPDTFRLRSELAKLCATISDIYLALKCRPSEKMWENAAGAALHFIGRRVLPELVIYIYLYLVEQHRSV